MILMPILSPEDEGDHAGRSLINNCTRSRDCGKSEEPAFSISIVLLAAGKASRMGEHGPHKLLAEFEGVPLIRRSAEHALQSNAEFVAVVTGYRQEEITASLSGLNLTIAENVDYASGMASSLKAGLCAVKPSCPDGVLVMLADMPQITKDHLNTLIAAFCGAGGDVIVRAVSQGRRGNPVVLPKSLLNHVMHLEGDFGARQIIGSSDLVVIDVDIGDAALLDVDTPEAVIRAGGLLRR